MGDLGLAIVGAGVVARYHAQAIAETPGARLVALCRGDAGKGGAAAAAFGVPCETSYESLLARRDVDAICLCTPSGLHARQAILAARAGRHVLVEKPMALTLEDAGAMVAAARGAGIRLGVAFQRRTETVYADLHAAIRAGRLGRPVLATASVPYFRSQEYYDSAGWRGTWALDGGGALMNQAIHMVDLLLWWMGDVEEVDAATATLAHDVEVEDLAVARLRFAGGAQGALVATTAAAPGFPHRLEVYGTRGGVQIEGESVLRWHADRPPSSTSAGPPAPGAGASPTGIGTTGHARLMADFVAAVRGGREPLVPGSEGLRSLAVVLAAYESSRTGRPFHLARPD